MQEIQPATITVLLKQVFTAAGEPQLPVTWADGFAAEDVILSCILQQHWLQEEEVKVIFDGPCDHNRAATLTQVTKLLKKPQKGLMMLLPV